MAVKTLYARILTATLVTMAVTVADVCAGKDKWSLEIGLAKQTYTMFEPVWLDVTLTNMTSDTQWTYGLPYAPNQVRLYIDITDSGGNEVPYTGPQFQYSPASGPGYPFAAGEKDYGTYNLLEFFGLPSSESSYHLPFLRFPFMPTGAYTIQAHYEDASSNAITLTIVQPAGEEKEILDLIEKATTVLRRDNSGPAAQIFREVVDRFPNSGFAEECYYLFKWYSLNTLEEKRAELRDFRDFSRDMLLHYPNSGDCAGWLKTITRDLTDAEVIDTLNKYEERLPQTRCSRFAEQMSRELKQKQVQEKGRE